MQLSSLIADDLHLVFLPAEHRLLDQHLAGRRGVEPALDDLQELLAVIGDAAAGAAKGEGRADDGRQPDIRQRLQRLDQALLDIAPPPRAFALRPGMLEGGERCSALVRVCDLGDARDLGLVFLAVGALQRRGVGEPRARRLEPDLGHRLAEQLAVLGLVDRLGPRADHLDAVFVEHAGAMQAERGVERRLAAHGRQDRVGPLLLDDLGDELGRDRLDISCVGDVGVGHDRGRVRVHQHDAIALFFQGLAGLRAGIVELAGLADDDRAGSDDQDRLYVCALGHCGAVSLCPSSLPSARRSG